MEIKVGDKVRVSKDAPIHIIGSASEIECKAVVLGTDADIAIIGFRTQERQRYDAYKVPTKYLTKVEDEEKNEPKFNVGDKVVVHYSTGDKMGRIQEVLYDGCYDVDYGLAIQRYKAEKSFEELFAVRKARTLTDDEVRAIRNERLTVAGFYKRFGKRVSSSTVQDVYNHKTYKDVI